MIAVWPMMRQNGGLDNGSGMADDAVYGDDTEDGGVGNDAVDDVGMDDDGVPGPRAKGGTKDVALPRPTADGLRIQLLLKLQLPFHLHLHPPPPP